MANNDVNTGVNPDGATSSNPTSGNTVVIGSIPVKVPSVQVPVNHGEKLEKFHGVDFKRWQQKMLLYLTTLSLARFLKEDAPIPNENEQDQEVSLRMASFIEAWKHADFLCRNYVLNSLHYTLYNVYSVKTTAKELWESLERKYKIEDAGSKKFVVGKFLDYKMVDSKTVISQVQEL